MKERINKLARELARIYFYYNDFHVSKLAVFSPFMTQIVCLTGLNFLVIKSEGRYHFSRFIQNFVLCCIIVTKHRNT